MSQVGTGGILDVGRTVAWLKQQPREAPAQAIDLIAQINPAPSQAQGPLAPPAGCPVSLEQLPTLTDQPFMTEFSVAGVVLPNPVPSDFASLRLVIPYNLGILDLPPRARLRGHLFDPEYASCPDPERIFVLEELVGSVPAAHATDPSSQPAASESWEPWADSLIALGLNYPQGWTIEETRNIGSILEARFQAADSARAITLTVTAGQTHWTPATDGPAPAALAGERQAEVRLGESRGRVVDAVGPQVSGGRQREIRIVFNYNGNTVVLNTRFVDGALLDKRLIDRFNGMVGSFRFDKPEAVSDPLDPTQNARSELGVGPFIGQETAGTAALASSRLGQAKVIDARLMSEKDAREATPGSCREFPERPQGVWLVRVRGMSPTGLSAERLVYLDAVTGTSICQADVVATPTP